MLAFGTGIGGGIVLNGEVYKGFHLYAGEASMICFDCPDPRESKQGRFFTDDCSMLGLTGAVAKAVGVDSITGEDAFALIESGDEAACAVFDRYLEVCAREIHNIQCLIDPERICLGGGVSKNPLFVQRVREAVEKFNASLPFAFPSPEIVPCKFFNDANLIGAYQHFIRMRRKRAGGE